jgi:ribose 5-phosphate isomerase B
MKIAIGSDHRGYKLKEIIKNYLKEINVEYEDFGAFSEEPYDYPDVSIKVGEGVSKGLFDFGILICSTGQGTNITANKVKGIRSALCFNPTFARLSREHNDANVLSLPADFINYEDAKTIVFVFLSAKFLKGRHERRVNKIKAYEGGDYERL